MTQEDTVKQEEQKSSGFSFKFHLMLFVLVNVMLFIINIAFTPIFLWVLYPLFSWLIAIILHLTALISKNIKSTKRVLLGHLSTYFSVNLLLIVIDYISSGAMTWVLYPIFFWGIGVLFHGIVYQEYLAKKPPKVGDSKMKLKLKQKFPQLDRSKARSKRDKLLAASASKKKGRIKPPKETVKPKGKKKEKPSEQIDASDEDKKEIEKTESEMDIKKDEVFCVVHKGPIDGTVYICPNCKTYYCYKCASVLRENGEHCWSCEAEVNP